MKKTLRMKFMLLLFALVVGISNAWADKKTGSWDLTTASDDWTSHECVTYFSQPYGMKKLGPYIINSNIEDFSTSGITSIKIGVKSLQNGGTTSILTVYLVDEDGETVGSGLTISPVNASSASSTTYKYVTFNSGFTNVTGFKVQCTTFGKNVLVNGASYEVTYSPAPAYTITAQSNNTTYGTVSLSGSVITGSPNSGYRYASPAYTVSSGTATVSQSGNDFTVTPSSDCTVTINFEAIPTYTATFSVNGATTSQSFLEGAAIEFPSDPANISGKKFVGWVMETIAEPTDEEPSFVNTATETMGSSNVTYYAVFATATASGDPVETLTQTLEYDTWTYGGATTNITGNSPYRLFHDGGYVESAAFDLSKLSKVIVYGGSYGGSYTNLTIGDVDNNKWKDVNVSGNSQTGENTFTDGNSLSGTKKLRVTSTCGSSSKALSGVRMTKVKIYTMEASYIYSGYCTNVEVYTITAASNNTDYGTVSLSGEVITGSPQSSCRYATPAYTVSPANSATVVQDGNEFTVTPSANTTVTINFELIPTYTLSSAVSPENAGMVTLGASSGLLEGATVSAEAAANAGYKFTGWSISGTGATLSSPTDNPTTVTIGTANATVTATFEEVTTYAITYSVNGVPNTVNVEENTAVDLSAPSSALIPVGYVFKGWRIATMDPTDTDPNDYVTSATSTADITYYAVMAAESLSNSTYTLNYDTDVSSLSLGYGTAVNVTASDGSAWVVKAYKNNGMQINTGKNSSIKVPTCSGNIQSIAITCTVAKAVGFSISDYSGSGTITYVVYGTDATSQTLDLSSHSVTDGYIVPKGGSTSITNIVVTYKVTTYSNFCTSVSTIALTDDVTIDGNLNISYELTVPSGKTLTVTGNLINTNPANLIIEDGGQLKFYGTGAKDGGVQATVEKNISGYGGDNTVKTGWNFIASPIDVNNLAPTAVTNMLTNTYDLYQLDDTKWENYKEHEGNTAAGFRLANGRGYLYANSTDVTLSFAGAIKPFNSENPSANRVSVKAGWNLIGNPYTFDVYVNQPYYSISDAQTGITANTDASNATAIKPCTGILVYAKSIEYVEFSENEPVASTGNHGNIQMTLAHNVATRDGNRSETIDNAIVSFNEDAHLEKFYFGEPEANIYIPQNGRDYAIAFSNRQGDVPLNFKTNKISTYTISFEGEEMNLNGVYLIDMLEEQEIDLSVEPSYTFIGSPADRAARFKIVFRTGFENSPNNIFAYQNGSDIVVCGEGELQIFDVMGRMVNTQRISGVETINVKSQGVYIMKLNEKTQKIVVR